MNPKYRIIYEDPDNLDAPAAVVTPSDTWLKEEAMAGKLCPVQVLWDLQDDEQKAIEEGRHQGFRHDEEKWKLQWTAPRVGPLTEEEAMEYLALVTLPRKIFTEKHNRPMFKIIKADQKKWPKNRLFRNAWRVKR